MAICKNCLHSDVCIMTSELGFNNAERMFDFDCKHFKDRNKFVELPCKVGDIVYQTDGIRIYENKINKIIFDTKSIGFDETAIGKSIFLTREDAEQVLKERENVEMK